MVLVNVDKVGALGANKDSPAHTLDPIFWENLVNLRCLEGVKLAPIPQPLEVFNSAPDTPLFALPVLTGTATFWVWTSETKAYVWDGSNHIELTRASGAYTTNNKFAWNGFDFHGIPILNNGVDVPQFWGPVNVTQMLQDLNNWPSTKRAKVVRHLGPYLVAMNMLEGTDRRPHRVLWSHPAEPGTLPKSWDITDPTIDAGETDLSDVRSGEIVDAMPLRGQLLIYKEHSTWRMRFIGGRDKFAFDTIFENSGILAPRCVSLVGDGVKHFVATQDDIVVHDGQSMQSVLTKKMHRAVFSIVDRASLEACFCFTNPVFHECWFCYPEAGAEVASRALVWNWDNNQLTEATIDYLHVTLGPSMISANDIEWQSADAEWLTSRQLWDSSPQTVALAIRDGGTFGVLDQGENKATLASRTGLAITGVARDKTPMVDFRKRKLLTRVYPRVLGTGPLFVRVGSQKIISGPEIWSEQQEYTPGQDEYVDVTEEGQALCIEFSSQEGAGDWEIDGYWLDLEVISEY